MIKKPIRALTDSEQVIYDAYVIISKALKNMRSTRDEVIDAADNCERLLIEAGALSACRRDG